MILYRTYSPPYKFNNLKKRRYIIVILIIGLPMLGWLLSKLAMLGLAYWLGTSMCQSTVYKAVNSPHNEYSAKILETDCGATTSWSTQIELESLRFWSPGKDVIVALQGRPTEIPIQIRWVKNNELEITLPSNVKNDNQKKQWQDITISYVLAQ